MSIIIYDKKIDKFIKIDIENAVHTGKLCERCNNSNIGLQKVLYKDKKTYLCIECQNQLLQCDHCKGYFDGDDTVSIKNKDYCHDCAQELFEYERCTYCGELIFTEYNEHAVSPQGNCYCYQCMENAYYQFDSELDKPENASERKSYYGIEIEMYSDTRCELSNVLANIFDNFVFRIVSDGSLRNGYGLEINTQPLPLEIFYTYEFEQFISMLNDYGYVDDSCGLHIHIDKKSISKLTAYKLALFLIANEQFAIKLSERDSFHYCNLSSSAVIETKEKLINKIYHSDKYNVLNTMHEDTYELRLFAGTIDIQKIRANIEFFESLRIYLKDVKFNEIDNLDKYLSYLKKNKNRYEYLIQKISEVYNG